MGEPWTYTFKVASWIFGFLLPSLLFNDRMASFGGTVLDRIISEISRLAAMSSKLEVVAFSICSSRAELETNQPAIVEDAELVRRPFDNENRSNYFVEWTNQLETSSFQEDRIRLK